MTHTAADALEKDPTTWHRDDRGRCPCGMCGKWVQPFRLLDVRDHLVTGLRALQFICEGCQHRLANPGRNDRHKAVKVSVLTRGIPGSEATARAHAIRKKAKTDPVHERLI